MQESGFSKPFDPIHNLGARILCKQPTDLSAIAKLECAFNNGSGVALRIQFLQIVFLKKRRECGGNSIK